jgi:carbamoyltransferase
MLAEMELLKEWLNYDERVKDRLKFNKKVYLCNHHIAHMASSYYLSRFNSSALMSIDGVGDYESCVIGQARGNEIKAFNDCSINYPVSIGLLYTAVTDYLGFIPHCDEGKVMGLAPYGKIETFKGLFEKIVN